MSRKSDKRKRPNDRVRMSATEASRSFARLLDDVEAGSQFMIHRRGKDICLMSPPPPFRGRTAAQCLEILQGRLPIQLDGRFEDDLLAIISSESIAPSPWDS
jgi:antitoxin (DNA-binding transcriptional repressor) of toxin-antitoxin stability system